MSSPEQERADQERWTSMEARLARIEAALGLSQPPSPAQPPPLPEILPPPLPEFVPPPLPTREPTPGLQPASGPEPAPGLEPTRELEPTMETRFGLGWLNRVAVVALLFGVGFFFKYAVDNQWIGPGMRVALGIAAATFSLFVGEWLWLRGQKVFAHGLTGLGLALLYLSFYASFGFYHLLPQGVAFLLMFLTTAAATALALHYNSQAVSILGLVGGYLTPALLSTGENRMWTLAGYTFVLNAGALSIARCKRWPALRYLALAATGMLYGGWASDWLGGDTRLAAFGWLSTAFLLFLLASAESESLWLLALNTGAYFTGSYFALDPLYHDWLGAFTLLLALVHGGLAKAVWNKDRRFGQLSAVVAAVALTLAIPIQFAGFRITMLWALEAAALTWIGARTQQPKIQIGAWFLFALVFFRLLASDARLFESSFFNVRLLTFAVSAGSLWIASRFALSDESKAVSYGGGHVLLLWALAMEVAAWARRTADPQDVSNISSTGISILMAVYALVLVVAGVGLRSSVNRILGLGLLALVIAKLYLLDVWDLSRGFRITAFLALGGLLLLVSYLYSRFKPAIEKLWRNSPEPGNPPL
jgi:uncharacterized membrane protein